MGKLVKNTLLYATGNILPQLFGFILLPLYTRYLTPTDYGVVTNMQTLTTILIILFTLCMETSIYRLYYDYKTEEAKKGFLGTIIISVFSVSTILLGLLFLFHNPISRIFKDMDFYPYYAIAIASAYVMVFSLIPKIYLQVKEKAAVFLIISIFQFIATTSLVIWYIVYRGEGALGMLKGNLFGNALLLPVFVIISYRIINFRFQKNVLNASLKYSLPIIPYILSNWVMNMSNRIFIDRYFTQADNGIYGLSFKIASISLILTSAVGMAYNPYFFKTANSENQVKAKKELYTTNNLIIITLLILGFCLAIFSKDLVLLFMNPKFAEAYKVIPLLVAANIFIQFISLSNLAFSQSKKTKQLMFIVLIVAAINILLNFLLIPPYGVFGSAYSAILSQAIYFTIAHLYSRRYYYTPFNWTAISVTILILFIVFAISYWFIDVSFLNLAIKLALILGILLIGYLKFSVRFRKIIDGNYKPEHIELPTENLP
jgi:O-antigen/teichoic acid export membrane protein